MFNERFHNVEAFVILIYTIKSNIMSNSSLLTQQGYNKLKNELHELKTTGRKEMARQIAEAREKGDLSENAEYDAAKEAQGIMEMKITKLEEILASAKIIDESNIDTSKVALLTKVEIFNKKVKKKFLYQIVSESEADLKLGKISTKSPIAAALLGKKVGEVVSVSTPAGIMELEILSISI